MSVFAESLFCGAGRSAVEEGYPLGLQLGFNPVLSRRLRSCHVCVCHAAEGMCADLLIWGVGCGYRLEGGMRDVGCG